MLKCLKLITFFENLLVIIFVIIDECCCDRYLINPKVFSLVISDLELPDRFSKRAASFFFDSKLCTHIFFQQFQMLNFNVAIRCRKNLNHE